ncbi:unnamed protein product [Medioppia subpectinata]|uniref:Flavin-containing monooxygenase n=1 Tax=Medioppia subpectinata TaxID=1979941 RepID=A0A7R9KG48_9ACAR|nr:unnamed protein product [Medioppia subpectinata]CAG2102730.1 unnamed protein product [Medioppia subpectinata]
MSGEKIRIGIIGGGASGSMACKACLEEGFEPMVFEKNSYTGGLWRYHDENIDGVASVAKSTIINSSKEMTAFSDFPPPKDFPNYMHNTKMVKYFDLYGESFRYEKYVKLRHDVIGLEPNGDYDSTGRWKLTARDHTNADKITEYVFDGVMICTGHHVQPQVTTFKDQHLYTGQIAHTHSYKRPDQYTDKKVVVVGIGNSGGDVAVELSSVSDKVYLSTRRGTWISNRVGPYGLPSDISFIRRHTNVLFKYLPYNILCTILESVANRRIDHEKYQLKPKHRILSQNVFVNDALPNCILSGTVVVKGDINRFTAHGVIFAGESKEIPCDVVLMATGYKLKFPFISQDLIRTTNNKVELFKYVFPPDLKHPKTLAFISLVQPLGATLPIGEMQCRWFAQLMAGKRSLPTRQNMLADIAVKQHAMKRYYESERHTIQVDWLNFMDELAQHVGVKPNLLKYFFQDRELWRALMFGPALPYQYRLEGIILD